jgi:hypothetical protein
VSITIICAASAAVSFGFVLLGAGHESEDWLALALGIFLLLLGCSAVIDDAGAQPVDAAEVMRDVQRPAPVQRRARRVPRSVLRMEPARLLAIMAWAESGARVTPEEIAALHEVIAVRSSRYGVSWNHHAYQYSAGLRNPRHEWLRTLDPRDVPERLPAYVRDEWPRVVRASESVIRGDVSHGCGATVTHWGGGTVDAAGIARLIRRGYRVADCPLTFHNVFLTREAR